MTWIKESLEFECEREWEEYGEVETVPKDSPNILDGLEDESDKTVKFPKRLRHKGRGRVLATICKRPNH